MKIRLVLGVALAAALGGALPASAAMSFADRLPPAQAVARFHDAHGASLWLRSPPAVDALLTALDAAMADGFGRGPELSVAIRAALARAQAGSPAARSEAERLMSSAFVLYAQALRWPGTARIVYADPALSPRVPTPEALLTSAARAPDFAAHVRDTAAVNPLYAQLRAAAAAEIRLLGEPRRALRASLDRLRVLPARGRYVLVDLASQQLMMMEDGREAGRMKVVVGKPGMATPLMAGTLHQVTFNPYWNVPVDLARNNIAPNVLKLGASWLSGRGYEVLSGWDDGATVLDPASVDWQAVADGRVEARIRQKPGAGNMMGAMKFEFPNSRGIYLHDTPDRALFGKSERTFSSGCVRLEDAARLGQWLLGRAPVPTSDRPELEVALEEGVPVYLTYLSVRAEPGGKLVSTRDVYGLDGGLGGEGGARVAAAR